VARLRDRLLDRLEAACSEVTITGSRRERLPHHASFAVQGVKSESLVLALDLVGISVSAGSPCAARTGEPSHVLRAMGLPPRLAAGAVCLTLGRWTRPEDVDRVLSELPALIERLRALSPFA
jgi:cysteine desulfurase